MGAPSATARGVHSSASAASARCAVRPHRLARQAGRLVAELVKRLRVAPLGLARDEPRVDDALPRPVKAACLPPREDGTWRPAWRVTVPLAVLLVLLRIVVEGVIVLTIVDSDRRLRDLWGRCAARGTSSCPRLRLRRSHRLCHGGSSAARAGCGRALFSSAAHPCGFLQVADERGESGRAHARVC